MSVTTIFVAVSFQDTPLSVISEKANAIQASGWSQYATLSDEWIAKFEKLVPAGETAAADAELELREIMGDYWRDLEDPGTNDQPSQFPPAEG